MYRPLAAVVRKAELRGEFRRRERARHLEHGRIRSGFPRKPLAVTLVCIVAVAAISAAAAPASANSAPVRFDATLVATTTGGGGWCCGTFVDFEGTGMIMGVGAVEFTGRRMSGCFPSPPSDTAACFRTLDLTLVARNGDTLVIRGNNEWLFPVEPPPQVTTWSVDEASSTGRFVDLAASGTYTFVAEFGVGVVITLSGTRHSPSD
jgi:hypothetical protein